jgi:hypothetical protein
LKLSHIFASALYGEDITHNLDIKDNPVFDFLAPHGEEIDKDEF